MIPDILPPTGITKMEFLMMKVLKCLRVMEDMDMGFLRPSTIPLVIADILMVVMLVEVDICHKIPATLLLKNVEHEFMLKVEVYIVLRPSTIPTVTQVTVVDC